MDRRTLVLATAEAEEIGLHNAARKHGVTVEEILACSEGITGTPVTDDESLRRAHSAYWLERGNRRRAAELECYTFWLGRDAA